MLARHRGWPLPEPEPRFDRLEQSSNHQATRTSRNLTLCFNPKMVTVTCLFYTKLIFAKALFMALILNHC